MSPAAISDCNRDADVLIIGAGPAGLSLGFELTRRAVRFLILERASSVADSWRRMPRQLKLASPWKANSLPGTRNDIYPTNRQMSRAEYLDYLVDYAERARLPIRAETAVREVKQFRDGSFCVQTSQGDYSARVVVNATGYFSNPFVPQIPGAAASSIPQQHVAQYRDAETTRAIIGKTGGLILIVGKRLSAGQIMIELAQAGFRIALSHRSPITYGAGPIGWWFLFRIFPWLEWLKLKTKGDRAASNDVRMPGGPARKMIENGEVETFPEIARFEQAVVVFADGRQLRPDLVLFATGFRPAVQHLASLGVSTSPEFARSHLRDLESTAVGGLYFLGVDHGRNFQSRFIRGIRKDAAFLAERLREKFSSMKR